MHIINQWRQGGNSAIQPLVRDLVEHWQPRGMHVQHIMGLGQVVDATLTPGAVIMADAALRYPSAEEIA